jgi:RNA polymerase sigma-70 factor, ECF subfamily
MSSMRPSAPQSETDETLAALAAGGDAVAFSLLAQRHSRRFFKVAYGVVLSREDAEDVVQEAFLKLWNGKARWQEGRNSRFTTWFYRVVYNQALDHLRRKPPFHLVTDEDSHASADMPADEALAEKQASQRVEAALKALPERQRTALVLVYKEELAQGECAAIMGISVKALESLLSRGKAGLKERLKSYDGRRETDTGAVAKAGAIR